MNSSYYAATESRGVLRCKPAQDARPTYKLLPRDGIASSHGFPTLLLTGYRSQQCASPRGGMVHTVRWHSSRVRYQMPLGRNTRERIDEVEWVSGRAGAWGRPGRCIGPRVVGRCSGSAVACEQQQAGCLAGCAER
jgi:hypothetical protein